MRASGIHDGATVAEDMAGAHITVIGTSDRACACAAHRIFTPLRTVVKEAMLFVWDTCAQVREVCMDRALTCGVCVCLGKCGNF